MILTMIAPLGTGDCEALGEGWMMQPVLAWSSLAFTAVGIAMIASAGQIAPPERSMRLGFGLLMAATGVGSLLYHGPQIGGAGFIHDATFLLTVWFVALMDPALSLGVRRKTAWVVFGLVGVVISIVLLIAPTSTNTLTGVAVTALVLSGIRMHQVGRIDGRWYATALAFVALALVFNAYGRTAASLCNPDSLLQLHALWHICAAIGLGAYFISMTVPRNQEPV
jgi:predicted membrane channel-forming protein YqfA (hemolysin III family)